MNNIEINQLKRDIIEYLGYSQEQVDSIGVLSDTRLHLLKKDIEKVKQKRANTMGDKHAKELIVNKVNKLIINKNPKPRPKINNQNKRFWINQGDHQKIQSQNRKPKILIVCDVKGWAWWLKSHFIKDHLKDEFDIDVVCVIGEGCVEASKIDQQSYDLYFTYGFSYIDLLYKVPKNKKVTGVTAHRQRHIIFPKMRQAGNHHANSMLLLKELQEMGFKRAYYLPNGVDADLFKPIKPIRKEGELIVGHVGKECPAKGQKEYILPAIQTVGCESATNLRTWKDRLPHNEMPTIYNEMDVFVVASIEDGTPNPALEAMACGRPIISNPIGNMPELIKDGYNGFLVPRKIGAYVDKIRYFKNNRDELIRMGENARKSILDGWTWKHQSENYRNMFRNFFKK